MTWLTELKNGSLFLTVYVQPRASRNGVSGLHGNAIKISLTAPPTDGKANKALIDYVARLFKVSKKDISIKSGKQSRTKRLLIQNVPLSDAREYLEKELSS